MIEYSRCSFVDERQQIVLDGPEISAKHRLSIMPTAILCITSPTSFNHISPVEPASPPFPIFSNQPHNLLVCSCIISQRYQLPQHQHPSHSESAIGPTFTCPPRHRPQRHTQSIRTPHCCGPNAPATRPTDSAPKAPVGRWFRAACVPRTRARGFFATNNDEHGSQQ